MAEQRYDAAPFLPGVVESVPYGGGFAESGGSLHERGFDFQQGAQFFQQPRRVEVQFGVVAFGSGHLPLLCFSSQTRGGAGQGFPRMFFTPRRSVRTVSFIF